MPFLYAFRWNSFHCSERQVRHIMIWRDRQRENEQYNSNWNWNHSFNYLIGLNAAAPTNSHWFQRECTFQPEYEQRTIRNVRMKISSAWHHIDWFISDKNDFNLMRSLKCQLRKWSNRSQFLLKIIAIHLYISDSDRCSEEMYIFDRNP